MCWLQRKCALLDRECTHQPTALVHCAWQYSERLLDCCLGLGPAIYYARGVCRSLRVTIHSCWNWPSPYTGVSGAASSGTSVDSVGVRPGGLTPQPDTPGEGVVQEERKARPTSRAERGGAHFGSKQTRGGGGGTPRARAATFSPEAQG